MAIPVVAGDRPCSHATPAGTWGRLWRSLFATMRGEPAEPSPKPGLRIVAENEHHAFLDLFARYRLPLLDYLYGMTRDRELAADLVQDTFLRAWAAAPDLAGINRPQAWLYRIATNVALNASRQRRRFEWLPLSRVEPEGGDEALEAWSALPPVLLPLDHGDLASNVAERDVIWTVLAELPPRWRAVLLLQTTAGFEVREIAALLHLSETNVRKCLFRAKERFRALYRRLNREGVEG